MKVPTVPKPNKASLDMKVPSGKKSGTKDWAKAQPKPKQPDWKKPNG